MEPVKPRRARSAKREAKPPTREHLLETSARLFLDRGYHATGVSAILAEAGVNAGSLYHFFPGKGELLTGVLAWYLDQLGPVVMAPVESATRDPVERVFALLGFYRAWVASSEFARGCPIGNLALELGTAYPAARALVERNFEAWIDVVAGWLEEARERFPRGTDPRALACFALTTMEGGVMLARARRTLEPFDLAVARLRDYFRLLERAVR
jgi:TetR/AcrR family transcriptional repressor of nem operon